MVQINFNAHQVEPLKAWEPIPAGWYKVTIANSEMKPTRDGQGSYLMLTMNVSEGQYINNTIITRLNIQNHNQQTVDLAYGELSAICHVTRMYQIGNTTELHGRPFLVKVTVKESTDEEGNVYQNNEIKGYKDIDGNVPGQQKQQTPATFEGEQITPATQSASTPQPVAQPEFGPSPSTPTPSASPASSESGFSEEIPAWAR